MLKAIISDTSCFIVLSNIGTIDLLQRVYGEVITTPEVVDEFGNALPEWVKIKSPRNQHVQQILELQLDKGEASTIALALEIPESTIILDDHKGRRVAEKLNLSVTGTLGVIIKAKKKGVIRSIKPYIQRLKTNNFYLTPELEKEILKVAEE